jgi:hypothetical protein
VVRQGLLRQRATPLRSLRSLCQPSKQPLPSLGLALWCLCQPATPLPTLVLWCVRKLMVMITAFRQVNLHVRLSNKILL